MPSGRPKGSKDGTHTEGAPPRGRPKKKSASAMQQKLPNPGMSHLIGHCWSIYNEQH